MKYLEKLFALSGKIAVVTGGLGILGTEYTKALLEVGVKVAVLDRTEVPVSHELQGYAKKFPLKFLQSDVTIREDSEKAFSEIKKAWAVPNILINNAALDFPPRDGKQLFEDYRAEDWNEAMSVNLTGTVISCQVFGRAMARIGGGSIINIGSTYGLVSPDQRIYKNFVKPASYGAAKAAVINLTKYLATYWAGRNVRVNALVPGGVFNSQPADFVKQYSARTPMGRMAKKDEYNGAILFLASEASSYMTGAELVIDGGWTAW